LALNINYLPHWHTKPLRFFFADCLTSPRIPQRPKLLQKESPFISIHANCAFSFPPSAGKQGKARMAWFKQREESAMLETLAIVLIILWLLGMISSYTLGGFVHVLLVVAVIMIIVRLIQGRRI
jgi:hypothetical protein